MPVYRYKCTKCENIHEDLISYAKREEPQTCPGCAGEAKYIMSAPDIRTSDSASRVDDSKPAWYTKWKEASNIRKEALNMPEKKRKKHREEVRKMGEQVNF